jgi:hypothetical protein
MPCYYAGIYEDLEVEEAMIDGSQAIVRYHVSAGAEASEQERVHLE